ncbi:hypothetical protein MAA_10522 [Metarhizium robertsii ARSEF 23]|uniref:C2H2-type domain-containing protein n=1 Tax=Metarhizium robertsii (strain ARSEF 23 / ATCC MYA-3075) TaxID=655844 RepID=E9FE23_METRA|nr:uncharacterized protein MAA_10522 [Metarhizium robertsii ARSEF 23]EFY94019.1 hypothetical protein MAA_10522 [Metarhizium robertsii ARSEF 23]
MISPSAGSSRDASTSAEDAPIGPKREVDQPLCCLYPGCSAKPFGRRKDLDRHYKQRHVPKSFYCDYAQCKRSVEPFSRLNRLREHLRTVHKEAIGTEPATVTKELVKGGQALMKWWRCANCLNRVDLGPYWRNIHLEGEEDRLLEQLLNRQLDEYCRARLTP